MNVDESPIDVEAIFAGRVWPRDVRAHAGPNANILDEHTDGLTEAQFASVVAEVRRLVHHPDETVAYNARFWLDLHWLTEDETPPTQGA